MRVDFSTAVASFKMMISPILFVHAIFFVLLSSDASIIIIKLLHFSLEFGRVTFLVFYHVIHLFLLFFIKLLIKIDSSN